MKFVKIVFIAICLLFAYSAVTFAQSEEGKMFDPTIKFKGYSQVNFTATQSEVSDFTPVSFSIRRLRFKAYGAVNDKADWAFQLGFDKQQFRLLDSYIKFKIKSWFNITVGQHSNVGARMAGIADAFYSSANMVMLERPMHTQMWLTSNGLHSYRVMGLTFDGKVLNQKLYYSLIASNISNSGQFVPSLKNNEHNNNKNGLSFWGRLDYQPIEGISVGGFGNYGIGQTDDVNTIASKIDMVQYSYGAHLFVRKSNFSLLSEFTKGESGVEGKTLKYNGFSADIGYRIKNIEPAFRYGFYVPNENSAVNYVEKHSNYVVGINYYINKQVSIRANYVFKTEVMETNFVEQDNNLFYCQLQYKFGK